MRLPTLLLVLVVSAAGQTQSPIESRNWINTGVQAYRGARYAEAIEDFQRAVERDPSNITAHLYLGTAHMTMFVPGAESPENVAHADQARAEFKRVLELSPNNQTALNSLASITFQQASGQTSPGRKIQLLDESRELYQRIITLDPQAKEAYYTIAVIDWMKWYPVYMEARTHLGMRPEDPGPLPAANVRRSLDVDYGPVLAEAVANLEKALTIDPQYSDAMAYMNLIVRERADLRDSPEQYRQEIQTANGWVEKALQTKKAQAAGGVPGGIPGGVLGGISSTVAAPPPPPPPPPPQARPDAPQRIRVGGNVQSSNLISKVTPVYPPLARQARIQGTVRFTAIIGKDGRILNLSLVSGHPLLVAAAQEAVKQWVYRPTLLNGEPVEVVTQIDVPFVLNQ